MPFDIDRLLHKIAAALDQVCQRLAERLLVDPDKDHEPTR
jgi:hypothetical protein